MTEIELKGQATASIVESGDLRLAQRSSTNTTPTQDRGNTERDFQFEGVVSAWLERPSLAAGEELQNGARGAEAAGCGLSLGVGTFGGSGRGARESTIVCGVVLDLRTARVLVLAGFRLSWMASCTCASSSARALDPELVSSSISSASSSS